MNKKSFDISHFNRWILVLVLSIFSALLVIVPIALKFYHNSSDIVSNEVSSLEIGAEIIAASITHYFFSLIVLSFGIIGVVIWLIYFSAALLVSYFFVAFGKNIDPFVVADILENISGLALEYLSIKVVLILIILLSLFCYLAISLQRSKRNYFSANSLIFHFILLAILFGVDFSNDMAFKKIRRNYPPISIGRSVVKYHQITNISDVNEARTSSLELISQNKIDYQNKGKKPRTVVVILGESVRSDQFFELLPKYGSKLNNSKNTAFFKDVNSCDTITRIAVPCMITNVDHKTPQDFLNAVNVIDIFNKLNFSTYWIDNQSLLGYFDATYSMLAAVSDVVIEDKIVNVDKGRYQGHDEVLLPYVADAINKPTKNSEDKFIVIHLLGSHWNLDQRYPDDFAFFTPTCKIKGGPIACSNQQITNSYKNSVAYGFNVLTKITELFEKENAIIFYSSDHGFSLGEGGRIGNASPLKPIEQISVPMMVWYSDLYKKENPNLTNNLRKRSAKKSAEKFSHEYLFHSILGCSNIKSELINQKLNLCN